MSEPKMISPLLDDYALGAPMSDRTGACCCPALHKEDKNRYILKVVSFPASQVQLDALLLTRAYRTTRDALSYFEQQAKALAEEAAFLQELAKLEGFIGYDAWQTTPMLTHATGYDVYLLGEYRRSLEKHMRRHAMTHLEAMNLGIDLCSALSVCRRAGRIYVNLKPSNLFLSQKKDFRIGDTGFVKLDELKYASMPERCLSPYAPPEARTLVPELNETADTYALGRILMQIYNGGILPPEPENPDEPLPQPAYADEKLTELLLKACARNPVDRWHDPAEMGHALVRYMQCSEVNDIPIYSLPEEQNEEDDTVDFTVQPPKSDIDPRTAQVWELAPEPTAEEETATASVESEVPLPGEAPVPMEPSEPAEPIAQKESGEAIPIAVPEEEAASMETVPTEEAAPPEVASADDTTADTPLPESNEITPSVESDSSTEDSFSEELKEVSALLGSTVKPTYQSGSSASAAEHSVVTTKKRKKAEKKHSGNARIVLGTLLVLFACAAAVFGGVFFYRSYYLLTVEEISIDGSQNEIHVSVTTSADPSLFTVTCSDSYGNRQDAVLSDGGAQFTGLTPGTMYKIVLECSGVHKLVGQISDVYTTPDVTNIVEISAVTGSEDGSVVLTLAVDGAEPEGWTVTCFADGQPSLTQDFSGHSVTIRGLTIGQTYTVQLGTVDGSVITGSTTTEFTAASVVMARELTVTAHTGTELTVEWQTPTDISVEQWSVRCYGADYDETRTVSECSATFSSLDASVSYTVEVTADQMTQPARLSVTANPVNITGYHVKQDSATGDVTLSWDYTGAAPENGWLLMYSIDGNTTQNVEKCDSASVTVSPAIPGASYRFTVASPDNVSIFNCDYDYTVPQPDKYTGHALSAYRITGQLLATPSNADWTQSKVREYTSAFIVGQSISVVLHGEVNFYLDEEELTVLYVIRGEDGKVIPSLTAQETQEWKEMWSGDDYHYAELDVPKAPDDSGSYTLDIYFNGKSVVSLPFTMEKN